MKVSYITFFDHYKADLPRLITSKLIQIF